MDATVRAETKRCALLANKAAAKARDGDWAAACRDLEDIEHGPGNALAQASAPSVQVVEPLTDDDWQAIADDADCFVFSHLKQAVNRRLAALAQASALQAAIPAQQPAAPTRSYLCPETDALCGVCRVRCRAGLADHIEQRIRAWRQRTMNKSGDHLALDDFMGQDSIDDLIDFVCDEWALVAAQPAAQQPAVEPVTETRAQERARRLAEDWHEGVPEEDWYRWCCQAAGSLFALLASPTAQPAALSLHERYWLDIRGKVIDALAAKGLQIVTTQNGVHLMPLGNATAQPSAPDVVADARRWQPIETAPEDGQCLVWCATDDGGEVMKLPRDKRGFWLYDSEPTFSAPFYIEPTHWMPLPPPPAIDAELDREGQKP